MNKSILFAVLSMSLSITLMYALGCSPKQAGSARAKEISKVTTAKEKLSYSLGLDIGTNIKGSLTQQSIDADPAVIAQAIRDALTGAKPLMQEAETRETMNAFQQQMIAKNKAMNAKKSEHMKTGGEKNIKEGEAFLAANKKRDGVTTLPSGLQFRVIKKGSGKQPSATDTVVVNYKGTLIDGTVFDSSEKNGGPATFPVGGVIPGWTEALKLMPVGSKWQVAIPSTLAYGERGAGELIGPSATLLFDIELVSIK